MLAFILTVKCLLPHPHIIFITWAFLYTLNYISCYISTFWLQQNTGVPDNDFVSYVNKWCEVGASLVGGCCRTTPYTIRGIYRTLASRSIS